MSAIEEALQQLGQGETGYSLAQHFVTRNFVDGKVERIFRAYYFYQISHCFRLAIGLPFLATATMLCFRAAAGQVRTGDEGNRRPPWSAAFADFHGDPEVMGEELALAMVISPLIISGAVLILTFTPAFNPRTYQTFVAVACLGTMLGFGWPVHVAAIRNPPVPRDPLFAGSSTPECGHELATAVARQMSNVAKRAAGHAAVSLLASLGVVISSPNPVVAIVLVVLTSVTSIARTNYQWTVSLGLSATSVVLPFHVLGLMLCILVAYMQSALLRSQFTVQMHAQVAANVRIEQLGREKERLDYERAFAIKRSSSTLVGGGDAAACGNSFGRPWTTTRSDPGAYRADSTEVVLSLALLESSIAAPAHATHPGGGHLGAVRADEESSNHSPLPIIQERGGDPGGTSSLLRPPVGASSPLRVWSSQARDPLKLSQISSSWEPRGASGDAASVHSSSIVSTSCSELGRAIRGAPPLGFFIGVGSPRTAAAVAAPSPAYPLRTPFYDEAGDGSVTWLHDEGARAPFALHVRNGCLTDAEGRLLGDEGVAHYIFVLDGTSGMILVHPSPPADASAGARAFRHSSFVAGQPVSAAGEMTIESGRLLVLSNHSGHYAPPPSCLHYVMAVLSQMGVAHLESVELELTSPVAGTAIRTSETDDSLAPRFNVAHSLGLDESAS